VTGASINSGDDIAGYVHGLGKQAALSNEFKIGDRVAAFHPMMAPGGAYADYAVAPTETTLLIPGGIDFESAATIPLTTLAAALALFRRQSLPPPWMKRSPNAPLMPLIIYGASSALGTYAVKLARHSNIHPIVAIGGESASYVKNLLDPKLGDAFVDYRNGPERMKDDIKTALKNMSVFHALDAISENKSWVTISQILSPGGTVSVVQGTEKYDESEIPADINISYSFVGSAHFGAFKPSMPRQPQDTKATAADIDFAYVVFRYIARMLARGEFEGHPYEIVPGGLAGVETGLRKLQKGEAKGVKYVYQVGQ
jgi:NADPH2:quinone reductase